MKIKPLLAIVVFAILLAGCSSGSLKVIDGGVSNTDELNQMTRLQVKYREDLKAAKKITKESGDKMGKMCVDELTKRADARDAKVSTEPAGVLSTLLAIRAKKRGFEDGISDDFRIACAPLISSMIKSISVLMTRALKRLASGGLLR